MGDEIRIITDASPVGFGAVLTQLYDGEQRVASNTSTDLSDVERRYSQAEKNLEPPCGLGRGSPCMYLDWKNDDKLVEYIYALNEAERWALRLHTNEYMDI